MEHPIPKRMSEGSSGFDLYADITKPLVIEPGHRELIPTGFALEMPKRLEAQVRPRSGLALKHGITVLNTPGTIDADYRGEVGVVLINHGQEIFTVQPGDRIAQLVFMELPLIQLEEVEELSHSNRNIGGFGHTGR